MKVWIHSYSCANIQGRLRSKIGKSELDYRVGLEVEDLEDLEIDDRDDRGVEDVGALSAPKGAWKATMWISRRIPSILKGVSIRMYGGS